MRLNSVLVENFKSYGELTDIPVSSLSVLMGANSSGKSTALQTLLALKQTVECKSPDIDLLLSGKYVTLGDFKEAVNNILKGYFLFGVSVVGDGFTEAYDHDDKKTITWKFVPSNDKDVILDELSFVMSNTKMVLKRKYDDIYDILVDGKRTAFSVGINNLICNQLYINYNNECNTLFYNFLSEILKCIFNEKKGSSLRKKEFVPIKTVGSFYYELLKRGQIAKGQQKDEEQKSHIEELASRVRKDIDKYCQLQFKYYENFEDISPALKETLLINALLKNECAEEIAELLAKYEEILEGEEMAALLSDYDSTDEVDISFIYNLGSEEKGKNLESDMVSDSFRIYRELVTEQLRRIFYVGPIREKPQGLYNVGFETIPKYVGTSGAYFASVLLRENKERDYILPRGEVEKMNLLEALDEWAAHLDVASEIHVEKKNSFGFSVSVSNTQRQTSDIMNVGIGTSQVLPVLITGLLSEEGEYLIFEQPELHLHPYSQSRLADFFVELVRRGRKIIIETHSEYFVLRLRYQILVNNISENDIVINFFQNKNGTKISQGKLSGYGNLQYPEDFRDETQKLLDDLMNAALEKRGE